MTGGFLANSISLFFSGRLICYSANLDESVDKIT
jgi:hypothetical protein